MRGKRKKERERGRERKRGYREREGRGWEGEKECVGEVVSAGRLVGCRPRRRRFTLSQVVGHPSALTLHSSLSEGLGRVPTRLPVGGSGENQEAYFPVGFPLEIARKFTVSTVSFVHSP